MSSVQVADTVDDVLRNSRVYRRINGDLSSAGSTTSRARSVLSGGVSLAQQSRLAVNLPLNPVELERFRSLAGPPQPSAPSPEVAANPSTSQANTGSV